MKEQLREFIMESYEYGDISLEEADIYMNFIECADLDDADDVDVLTEMVESLSDDDVYYEVTRNDESAQNQKELAKKKAEKKAKRNKVLKAAGKGALAVGALAGAGYAGYRLSDRNNREKIDNLERKLDTTKKAFKYANSAKRTSMREADRLSKGNKELQHRFSLASDAANRRYRDAKKYKDAFKQANAEKRSLREYSDISANNAKYLGLKLGDAEEKIERLEEELSKYKK